MKQKDLEALLKDMSLQEKVMQLVQIPGSEYVEDAEITGIDRGNVSDSIKSLAGSTLGVWGTKRLCAIQEKYVKAHPHHIPLMFMLDVIHGHKTVFPCPLGQGASFDPETTEKAALVQAREAASDGVHATFSPMADLCRDARWGRVMESTGEDKYLNSLMASSMVRGYQGSIPEDNEHIASCVKHFAAYGAAEAGRDYNNTELSEHTLRDFYLKAYAEAIKQNPAMVMTSFNTINGIPSSGNEYLMRKILREEMGFKGVLISDWGAVGEMTAHGFAEDLKDAAVKAINAGVDIDMCSGAYSGFLVSLVEDKTVPESLVDEAVMRVLKMKNDLGLFEDPYRGIRDEKTASFPTDETRALARKAVAGSLVMLENKGDVLPLAGRKIAFIGPYADNKKLQSSWAFSGEDENTVTVWEAAGEAFDRDDIRFAKGCEILDQDTLTSRGIFHADDYDEKRAELEKEAVSAASWADTVIMCLGEDPGQSGEAASRAHITLPEVQLKLLKTVREAGKKTVTLIFTGRPLELSSVKNLTDSLVICWLPGTEGGHGIMDVLTGKVSPSGRLPMSFPVSVGQEPLHYDMYPTGRPKPEEGRGEFTSRYLDSPNGALYPFGFGLSYSEFEYSAVTVSSRELTEDTAITALVTVRNTGKKEAETTAQLYIRDVCASRTRPVRELAGIKKLTLKPGEEAEVSFEIREDMLRFWRGDEVYGSEPGKFMLWISQDSVSGKGEEFTLA